MLARSTLLLSAPAGSRMRRPARNRAFEGIDNAAMSLHLAPGGPFRPGRRDIADEQLFADYRRRSVTADSDTTSSAGRPRGEQGIPSTTPIGSYINGVLGGPRHPGLADDDVGEPDVDDDDAGNIDDGDPETAATSADAAARSFTQAASDSVVRLRAENAKLVEMLHSAEQRLRQIEREKAELADKAVTLVEELAEAKEELRDERKLTAALRSEKADVALPRRAHTSADETGSIGAGPRASPTPSRTTLDGDLEQASRRLQSLERSMLEMKRRFAARPEDSPDPPETLLLRGEAGAGMRQLPGMALLEEAKVAAMTAEMEVAPGPGFILATGAMSQEIAELRTSTEVLRRRIAQQDERQRQQLEKAEEGRSSEKRTNEDALLAISLGLETAKAQNTDLRRQLDRSEKEKSLQSRRMDQLQTDYTQMRASAAQTRHAWEEWAAKVEAGREELRRLGEANAALRERLAQFERSLYSLQRDLDAAKAEAALTAERCQRLAADAERSRGEARKARDSEAKAAQLNAGMAKLLALADAENRGFQRRLGILAEAAQRSAAPELGRHLRELAGSVRTDFQVAGSGPDATEHVGTQVRRQSHIQLAALIEQIDMVESRSDSLLTMRRRAGESGMTPGPTPPAKGSLGLNSDQATEAPRTDVQRLMRMLLYNSRTA